MNWKKGTLILLNVIIGIYLVLAITAFNKPDEHAVVCTEVHINIGDSEGRGFLTVEDVKQMLHENHLMPIGQEMNAIHVRPIKEKLESNDMIEEAECYKAQAGRVCINIRQRIPVVRVLTQSGGYYVDNKGGSLQAKGYASNVVVATGCITKDYASKQLVSLANALHADKFWNSQIVQINVLDDGSVELVPRVGDHIIYIGQPTGIERKLDRVAKFYRYGLSKAGWNKYSRINVEFDNQIIFKRRQSS